MRLQDEGGFTLIELIVASLLIAILMSSILTFLVQSRRLIEIAIQGIRFNREARMSFSLVANGFHDNNTSTPQPGERFVGIRGGVGESTLPVQTWIRSDTGNEGKKNILMQLSEEGNVDNRLRLFIEDYNFFSTEESNIDINNVQIGWFYNYNVSKDQQIVEKTIGVDLQLINPSWVSENTELFSSEAARGTDEFRGEPSHTRESYRTAFYCPIDQWN